MGVAAIKLKVWLHPAMQVPFKLSEAEETFHVDVNKTIGDLMIDCEDMFEAASAKAGKRLELQINVCWNIKDHSKALNPNEKVSMHFANGDLFGVYGEILPLLDVEAKIQSKIYIV